MLNNPLNSRRRYFEVGEYRFCVKYGSYNGGVDMGYVSLEKFNEFEKSRSLFDRRKVKFREIEWEEAVYGKLLDNNGRNVIDMLCLKVGCHTENGLMKEDLESVLRPIITHLVSDCRKALKVG